ncbi:uncharacterized protein K02A2.6-like [Ipomoea triloba]|uniref:uncharacterized protein K02A2.6-like n=1 Tax=Ipomoea triloba TaxID=35885 RepID=UPI00125E2F25|nr:uncharacterized protein K02A2.6-like [Ipomoea triloba]
MGIVQFPPQCMKVSPNADQSKYCRFHRQVGHDTDECNVLKCQIEELIQRGYFRQFVKRSGQQQTPRNLLKNFPVNCTKTLPGRSATNYTPVSTAIPFSRWGIDLVGAIPTGSGSRKYIIVAIDYFTKWVEAEPLGSITAARCKKFVEKNILCRFGIPIQIITDNGCQFEAREFSEFLTEWGIKCSQVAVSYPRKMIK